MIILRNCLFVAVVAFMFILQAESRFIAQIEDGGRVISDHIVAAIEPENFNQNEKDNSDDDTAMGIIQINESMNITGLLEGDIIPHPKKNQSSSRKRRNVQENASLWPKNSNGVHSGLVRIPYVIRDIDATLFLRTLSKAIGDLARHTCIRFVPRQREVGSFVSFENGPGCSAHIGKADIGKLVVNLNIRCWERSTILHEMLHAIGFHHEHTRSDRDSYIKILFDNIDDERKYAFWRQNTESKVIYDYNSILHYDKTAFGNLPYVPTMQAVPRRNPEVKIGRQTYLSPYDIEKVKYHYNCGPGTYERCGRDFVDQVSGSFQSPSYPSAYPKESHCTWNITVRRGRYVKVTFKDVSIAYSHYCQKEGIYVHNGRDAGAAVLKKICGVHRSDVEAVSSGRSMFVIFSSDTSQDVNTGFRAIFNETISPGIAPTPPSLPTLPPITNTIERFECDFERDICGMSQDQVDQLDWERRQGGTDHRQRPDQTPGMQGRGYFIYVSHQQAHTADSAIIRTPWMNAASDYNVNFSYFMNGPDIGGMRLYAFEKRTSDNYGREIVLWKRNDTQGSSWKDATVKYTKSGRNVMSVQFYWEVLSKHRRYDSSIMAVDDISISRRIDLPARDYECDFELSSMCVIIHDNRDTWFWTRHTSQTPTAGTGPSGDHTPGTRNRGYYLYMESDGMSPSNYAVFRTPKLSTSRRCLTFWYHMWGSEMGNMSVYAEYIPIRSRTGRPTSSELIFVRRGSQGGIWNRAEIQLERRQPPVPSYLELKFVGIRGTTRLSDMAVDDIETTVGLCETRPTATTARTTTRRTITTSPARGGCSRPNNRFVTELNEVRQFFTDCLSPTQIRVQCCSLESKKTLYSRVSNCNPNSLSPSTLSYYCRP